MAQINYCCIVINGKDVSGPQKTENSKILAKECDIRFKKFKNFESPRMVSKRLNGKYLMSYEQLRKIGF